MSALVSVVMPVYNCERFVAEAVESALAQDHRELELIVIDDGSSDRSREILAGFGDAIRLVTVPNGGPARARNLGMTLANGSYIAFLDADDVWLPGKISAQVAFMEAHPEVGTSYTAWHVWHANQNGAWTRPDWSRQVIERFQPDPARSGWIYDQLLFDCMLLTTTVMIRTATARLAGEFDNALRVGEDYDYWIRLSRLAQVSRHSGAGALYRVVPSSASRRPHLANYEFDVVQRAIERYGLTSPDGRSADPHAIRLRLRQLLFQHGYIHLKQGDPQIALQAFARSLRDEPWQPRLWIHSANAWVRNLARRNAVKSA